MSPAREPWLLLTRVRTAPHHLPLQRPPLRHSPSLSLQTHLLTQSSWSCADRCTWLKWPLLKSSSTPITPAPPSLALESSLEVRRAIPQAAPVWAPLLSSFPVHYTDIMATCLTWTLKRSPVRRMAWESRNPLRTSRKQTKKHYCNNFSTYCSSTRTRNQKRPTPLYRNRSENHRTLENGSTLSTGTLLLSILNSSLQ